MSTGREEEQLIHEYKEDFTKRTGKSIKMNLCSKWESAANFTDRADFWRIVQVIFDYTGWTKRQTFSRGNVEEKVFRRGLIDYIAVNNGCSIASCGRITNRDHTTVINSVRKFEMRLETDTWTKRFFSEVMNYLRENYHLYKKRIINENTIE